MDARRRGDFLAQTADQFYGRTNRALRTSIFAATGNLQNVHRITNKTTLDEADRQQMQARFTSDMQEAMAPLGHGSVLQRAVDAMQDIRPGDQSGILKAVARTLGGLPTDQINQAILPALGKLNEQRQAVEKLQQQVVDAHDPTQRAALMAQLEAKRRELTGQTADLAKIGEQFGLFSADSLGHEDLTRGLDSTRGMMTAQADLIGIRGSFGNEVTAEQIADFKKTPALDVAQQIAVEAGRRQRDVDAIKQHLKDPSVSLTEGQKTKLAEWTNHERLPGMTEAQAQQAAVAGLARNADWRNVAVASVRDLKADSDADIRVAIRTARQMVPYSPTDEDTEKLLKANPELTREEAAELGTSRLRAKRFGVSDAEVAAFRAANTGFDGHQGEIGAISALLERRATRMDVVSPDDIARLKEAPGFPPPKPAELDAFRAKYKISGSDAAIEAEMLKHRVLFQRKDESDARFNQLWQSQTGAAFRDLTNTAFSDIENIAGKLVHSPQTIQRLGTQAIEMSEQLRAGQQRMQELAFAHTGGDMTKLMARQLNLDPTKLDYTKTRAGINTELDAIQKQQRTILATLYGQEGLPGRQFRLGSEEAALKQVLDAEVAAGRMPDKAAEALKSNLSPENLMRVAMRQRELGSDANVRKILGLAPDAQLSELDQARVAGVRFGAGNETEAIGIYGRERYSKLTPEKQREALSAVSGGVATEAAARTILGLAPDAQLTEVDRMRVAAVQVGLKTEAHAGQLLGGPAEGESAADYAGRVQDVMEGMHSRSTAARSLGLRVPVLPEALAASVLKLRERTGNEEEARRLHGYDAKQSLSFLQRAQLARTAADVGIARRLTSADDVKLREHQSNTARMQRLRETAGLSAEQITKLGETVVLTPEQRLTYATAKRQYASLDPAIQKEALKAVTADAAARDVTPKDYLEGKGFMSDSGLAVYREAQTRAAGSEKELTDLANRLGIKPEDLLHAGGIGAKLATMAERAAKADTISSADITKSLLSAYGFDTGTEPSEVAKSIAKTMDTPEGRVRGTQVLRTARTLGTVAGRRTGGQGGLRGVDEMADAYFKLREGPEAERAAKVGAFQKQYQFDTDERGMLTGTGAKEYEDFEQAMHLQQQMKLLGVGRGGDTRHRRRQDEAALKDILGEQPTIGKRLDSEQSNAGGTPRELTIHGTLRLTGDGFAELSGASGGSRNFTPHGA
jgi:hypothetical protein